MLCDDTLLYLDIPIVSRNTTFLPVHYLDKPSMAGRTHDHYWYETNITRVTGFYANAVMPEESYLFVISCPCRSIPSDNRESSVI